jgi:hypothetical protein
MPQTRQSRRKVAAASADPPPMPELVADVGEHHQAVEKMVAIGAPADDVQMQVDLRRRGFGPNGHGAADAIDR